MKHVKYGFLVALTLGAILAGVAAVATAVWVLIVWIVELAGAPMDNPGVQFMVWGTSALAYVVVIVAFVSWIDSKVGE